MAHERLGLFDTPPSWRETRLAIVLVGLLFLAFVAVLPLSPLRVGEAPVFVPVIEAVVFVGELIITALLFAQAAIFRSRALMLLASAFLCIAILLAAHGLSFPGAFAPSGLLGGGLSTTGWIMIFRRMGFPIALIFYAFLKEREERAGRLADLNRPIPKVLPWAAGAMALALAMIVLAIASDQILPPMFVNRTDTSAFNIQVFNLSNIALVLVAMAVLFVKRHSVLDMWLQVSLAGWLIQSLLNVSVHARFTLGFYCLFLVILASHLFVLLALIAESNQLYARLALSSAARDRERETRMMSMEAVAAAISHELGQPLTAVTLSATAGLNSLTREHPEPDRAIRSLRDTIDAGHRAFDVIKSIRAAFSDSSGMVSAFSFNHLVRETVSLMSQELSAQKIDLQLALNETEPCVRGNRVQIQRVIVNLLNNAIEALDFPGGHPRRIAIRSTMKDARTVLLEISDSGVGIEPAQMAQIFDPFFTTKSTGTGLGLSLSRTILEEHHGRLWATPGHDHGATFHIQLPCVAEPAVQH